MAIFSLPNSNIHREENGKAGSSKSKQRAKECQRVAVQEAEAALRHAEVVGKFQFGRGGLGLGSGKPDWNKAGPKEKRKLVMEQVRRQE